MKKNSTSILLTALIMAALSTVSAQQALDSILPVRGFCIGAPKPNAVNAFVTFINKELAPRKVNTLILRVDYNYQYTSHPELRDSMAL